MTPDLRRWFTGRRVLVTGHTGFKGAWLTAWLRASGASVTGVSLAPPDDRPSLFVSAALDRGIRSVIGDVRDRRLLGEVVAEEAPEVVFHLAAQSLVRPSYRDPITTFDVNVMGTACLLDALRTATDLRCIVVVTSDKCYENPGTGLPLAEGAPMGGHEPYSASKGCAELVTSAMRRSYFTPEGVAVATARAGNVIGGGDWADERLVPDLARAAAAGDVTRLRHPEATRPWQFVLEPLRGYLMLARALAEGGARFEGPWNFGPSDTEAVTVAHIAELMAHEWPQVRVRFEPDGEQLHEAPLLQLDCTKAHQLLGWRPAMTTSQAIQVTAKWYQAFYEDPTSAGSLVDGQLSDYESQVTEVMEV